MSNSYIENYLNLALEGCRIIPLSACPSKFYTITLQGWEKLTVTVEDSTLNEILYICNKSLEAIISQYKQTHAFSEPMFFFNANGMCGIKIATLENEIYELIVDNKNNET